MLTIHSYLTSHSLIAYHRRNITRPSTSYWLQACQVRRSALPGLQVSLPGSPSKMASGPSLPRITQEIFPEISRLIQILLTYPVTSCEGERSYSLLRRLLTWNRSSMTTERLVNLGRMAMHPRRLASLSDESILNQFILNGPRRMSFSKFEEGRIFLFSVISLFSPQIR